MWPTYTRDVLDTKQFLCVLQLTSLLDLPCILLSCLVLHQEKVITLSKNPQDPSSIMPRVLLGLFELDFFFILSCGWFNAYFPVVWWKKERREEKRRGTGKGRREQEGEGG